MSACGQSGRRAGRNGQAMVEYVIVLGLLLSALAILSVLLYTTRDYGDRIIGLVASEFP